MSCQDMHLGQVHDLSYWTTRSNVGGVIWSYYSILIDHILGTFISISTCLNHIERK